MSTVWRHVKRGTFYRVVDQAQVQCSAPINEGDTVTVYVSLDDGNLWVRPRAEFEDGRFAAASDPAPTPPEDAPSEYERGCAETLAALLAILDGKDTGEGACPESWESIRRRVLALMAAPLPVGLTDEQIRALWVQHVTSGIEADRHAVSPVHTFVRAVEAALSLPKPEPTPILMKQAERDALSPGAMEKLQSLVDTAVLGGYGSAGDKTASAAQKRATAAMFAEAKQAKHQTTDTDLIRRSDALAEVPGGSVCDPQQVADALRAVPAALPKPEAAEPAPGVRPGMQPCCQQYETCRDMCASRADYWQGQAAQLKRAAEPQESVDARPDDTANWLEAHSDATRRMKAALRDPLVVHAALLRGEIAKPDIRDMLHVYGAEALARWDRSAATPPETPGHLVGAVPDGWQLVPIKPTQAMCQEGQWKAKEWMRFPLRIVSIYEAMLAAAPSPQGDAK